MAFKHVLMIGVLAAGVSACKPAQPGPAQQAEIKAPAPCNCATAAKAPSPAKAAPADKAAPAQIGTASVKTAHLGPAHGAASASKTLVGVSRGRVHGARPFVSHWRASDRSARRAERDYAHPGRNYVPQGYADHGGDLPLAGAPRGHAWGGGYGVERRSSEESYSQHVVVQDGYAGGVYAQGGYSASYGQVGYGAQAYSGVRSYNVSQSTRGDVARSRAERRVRCPW